MTTREPSNDKNTNAKNTVENKPETAVGSSPPSPPKKKPGPKHPHKGQFKKGYDPRRQTPITFRNGQVFRELCREKSPEMLELIIGFARDEEETTQNRYNAAKYIIEQGYGKPTTPVAVAAEDGDIKKYSAQQIDNAIARALGMDTIEGEVVPEDAQDGPGATTIDHEG